MSTNMKGIKDEVKNAKGVLDDTLQLISDVSKLIKGLQPYNPLAVPRKALNQYAKECAIILNNNKLAEFKIKYSHLADFIVNGDGKMRAVARIQKATYDFRTLQFELEKLGYIMKDLTKQKEYYELARSIISCACAFAIMQFELNDFGDDTFMSVYEVCERDGLTKETLYANLVEIMNNLGTGFYVFEEAHKYYNALNEMAPELINTCEENMWNMTDELIVGVLENKISPNEAANYLAKNYKTTTEEMDLSLENLVSKMVIV